MIPETLAHTDNSVGIDLGISTFATLSNGTKIDAPKPLKKQLRSSLFQRSCANES
ncbi:MULTISPECIES: transposase [Okeania]|uniref:transposase n=1 Tax=Okeania TaxID=1458928 RepID=UPI0023D9102B|nr:MULTISPECIES: transposase [Okeania]